MRARAARLARWAHGHAGLLLALAAGCACVLGWALTAEARPGGGHSYSGGGGHSYSGGSSSGSSDGGGLDILIYLLFRHPQIGIPVTVIAVAIWVINQRSKRGLTDWDSGPSIHHGRAPSLEPIRVLDPDFSVVLFEDFVYRLYAQAHGARGTPDGLSALAPYLGERARGQLSAREPTGVPVTNVVIGAMRVTRVTVPEAIHGPDGTVEYVRVGIDFETNMTVGGPGQQRTQFQVEHWELSRAATARTRPPGAARDFPCPNCGAPFVSGDASRCDYCGEVVDNGRFDWLVVHTAVTFAREGPPTLTGTTPERGTDLPTYFHDALEQRWHELAADDPAVSQAALGARIQLIYDEMNQAWQKRDLTPVRGLVSDGMYDYLRYWILAYREQGLRNVLEDMRLGRWVMAKITRDRYFDAITVRIWGSGKDYTVRDTDRKVVGGSKHMSRAYSEYWTLIRSADSRGEASADKSCPKCGAALDINMAGCCTHCNTHITSGEFDWVLSKIEQDDSYRG